MKRAIGCIAVLMLVSMCGWAGPVTMTTFAVNPQDTFLYQSANDVNIGALFISLTGCTGSNAPCINAAPGSTITLVGLGEQCFSNIGGAACTEYPAELGAAFDSNNVLLNSATLSPGNVNRLTGSINAAGTQDVANLSYFNTWYVCTPVTSTTNCVAGNPGTNTTIPNDFLIPTGTGITVTVPVGAQYLVIGVFDSFSGDNSDPLNNLALEINQQGAPEPSTLGLAAAGLGALAFLRRRRSR